MLDLKVLKERFDLKVKLSLRYHIRQFIPIFVYLLISTVAILSVIYFSKEV